MNRPAIYGALAIGLLGAGTATAGGLWLNEFGDFSGGRSSAGGAAGVDEAGTIIHNPASGTRIEGNQLMVSAGMFLPDTEFDIDYTNPISGNDDGGSAGLNAPAGGFAYVHDLDSDRWSAGVYFAGLSGAGLEYNQTWVGRFQATDVELLLVSLAPTVGYQVTDRLSIGASLQWYYSTLELKLALPSPSQPGQGRAKLDGSDDGFGYTLGAMYEFSDSTRIGVKYQSELDVDYDGKLRANVADVRVDSNTELTMAQFVRVSLHHDLNDEFSLAFTWGWDDWSALDSVFVSVPEREGALQKNWDDTYHYAAGLEYRASDKWHFTTGVSYDTNPVSAHDRTADLPVDRQVRISGGTRYQLRDNMTVGGYINYMDLGSAKIHGQRWGGEYENNSIWAFAINLNWTL